MYDFLIDDTKPEDIRDGKKANSESGTKYLDSFMEQCLEYENSPHSAKKYFWPTVIICILALIILKIIESTLSIGWLRSVRHLIYFILVLIPFIVPSLKRYEDRIYCADNIRYDYIDKFLFLSDTDNFKQFGASYCISDGSVHTTNNNHKKLLHVIFIFCTILFITLNMHMYSKPSVSISSSELLFIIIMFVFTFHTLVYTNVDYLIRRIICKKKN